MKLIQTLHFGFLFPRRMDDTKGVIDLSGVFLFPGVITVFEVLSFWMWISHPMEASLGIIFRKQLSNTVKINAFPSPLRLTCYATSADTKAKTIGPKSSLPWFVSEQSVVT